MTEIYQHKTKTFVETQWKDISVGDILRIKDGKPFPADLILLSSSEPQGICYIETSNLDGETNLKIKSSSPVTCDVGDSVDGLKGELQCEQPNRKLYEFNGNIKIDNDGNDKPSPLNPNSLLLRGAKLMNTPWICGNFSFFFINSFLSDFVFMEMKKNHIVFMLSEILHLLMITSTSTFNPCIYLVEMSKIHIIKNVPLK